jgi:hypothetical protein
MATTETGTALRAKIEAAGREELGKLYEKLVGYNPFGEDLIAHPSKQAVQEELFEFCRQAELL